MYQKKVTIEEGMAGRSVKELLTSLYVPKYLRGKLRKERGIQVNGRVVSTAHLLSEGDELCLTLPAEAFEEQGPYPANDMENVPVVFENEDLLVLDKPSGMKMHAHSKTEEDTLLNYVAADLKKRGISSMGQPAKPYMTHRLDRGTSGLVIVGKNPLVVPVINRLIKEKAVKKTYHALLSGTFSNKKGVFDQPIGPNQEDERLRAVCSIKEGGQSALTSYQVLSEDVEGKHTLVALELHTGRMHQLRVHLANAGHPIVGDDWYGGDPAPRLMLQSTELDLPLPFSTKRLHLQLNDDFIKSAAD